MGRELQEIQAWLRTTASAKRLADERFKETLERAYRAGLSDSQIAAETGETYDCVRVRRRRGAQRADA